MRTLIPATDHASLWALIAVGTTAAIWLEQTYRWAARLSGPVIALLIAMLLSNTRVVPTEAPAYDFVGDWLVPLAIPLLLFRANLREIFRAGWKLLVAFHLAALGTLLGTALAVWLLHDRLGPTDTAHAAGLMAASYIGGGVNMLAVKASYYERRLLVDIKAAQGTNLSSDKLACARALMHPQVDHFPHTM